MDCPPVSAVSDPLVIASRCDAVLFVTRFNKVRRDHVRRSTGKFTHAGIPILGLCINDLSFETSDAYYYAYERYGYYSSYHKSPGDKSSGETDEPATAGSKVDSSKQS